MINKELNFEELKNKFLNNNPNYIIIDDLFDTDFIKECEKEFLEISDDNFFKYSDIHFEFEKYALNEVEKMPSKLKKLFEYIHSLDFVNIISKISNIDDLTIDSKRWGGGLHKTKKNGYLSIHKDFNVLPDSYRDDIQLLRCINLIGYITDENQQNNDGYLEFWKENEVICKVENKFNRWIFFDTRNNFHGHPYPFKGNKPRMSIASYYYKKEKVKSDIWSSTEYTKLPWMEDSEEYRRKIKDRSDYKKRYKKLL